MTGPIRSKYEKVKIESEKLQTTLDSMQTQMESYKTKLESMKKQIGLSSIKQEALSLLERLHAAELERQQLVDEMKNTLSPAEEKQKLIDQIKDNNQEISAIEKQ
jgi:intraflagellar transport protein 74